MTDPTKFRIAVVTFVYEGDREIVYDTLDSIVRSCRDADIEFFITDDASPSQVGRSVVAWCAERGLRANCIRYDKNGGYRGAIERTLRVLKEIAICGRSYDIVLRIDTDAIVVRPGLDLAVQDCCTDRSGLYGVHRVMRRRDGIALLLDLLPIGLKRNTRDGRIDHAYSLTRTKVVWWWKIGARAFLRGFRFTFVDGCCYALGGTVPQVLLRLGYLDLYDEDLHGLITSEEDVIVTLMCLAAGIQLHNLAAIDPTWQHMNGLGEAVLRTPLASMPFVVHPLKATPQDLTLRKLLRERMPLFVTGGRVSS